MADALSPISEKIIGTAFGAMMVLAAVAGDPTGVAKSVLLISAALLLAAELGIKSIMKKKSPIAWFSAIIVLLIGLVGIVSLTKLSLPSIISQGANLLIVLAGLLIVAESWI